MVDGVENPGWERRAATIVLAVGFGAYLARMLAILIRLDGYEIAKYLFADDAFYYLRIARNIADQHRSTFDGTVGTNGYHPLWELVCVAVSFFFPAASRAQISAVAALQGALNLFAAWMIYSALRVVRPLAAAAAAVLLLASSAVQLTLLDGMESTLGFALMAVLLRLAVTRGPRFAVLDSGRYAASIFVLLAAVAFTRLEMGLVGAVFLGLSAWRSRRERALLGRTALVLVGLGLLGGAYLVLNYALFSWPVPISGSVKWLGAEDPAVKARTWLMHLHSFVAPLRLGRPMEGPLVGGALGLLLATALAAGVVRRPALREAGIALGLPCLIYILVVSNKSGGFFWYGWPALFVGTLATFALVDGAIELVGRLRADWLPRTAMATAVLVSAFVVVATAARVRRLGKGPLYDWSEAPTLMDHAIRFVQERIPRSEVLSGASVGLISYMTDRGIFQTEGLVNDRTYLEALRARRTGQVLRARDVRWMMTTPGEESHDSRVLSGCAVVGRHSIVDEYRLKERPDTARALGSSDIVFLHIDPARCPEGDRNTRP